MDATAIKTFYVRYTRIDAKFHIVRAAPGEKDTTPALCGHRWGRRFTEEWLFRPSYEGHRWCEACRKLEGTAPAD